ncbi:MAG: autotransporter domain-containing protein [Phascolarctobacterium sp.]|nr:autotransporter domain-containing protein [Candidatus Phascolarctobacterium caballi]
MKKLNLRKQYWAYAVLAAVCAGFIYTPQMAEAKFGKGETTSVFAKGDEATFLQKGWYVVGVDSNVITLFSKEAWGQSYLIANSGNSTNYKDTLVNTAMATLYGGVTINNKENIILDTVIDSTNVKFYAPSMAELVSTGASGGEELGTFELTKAKLSLAGATGSSPEERKAYWTRDNGGYIYNSGTQKTFGPIESNAHDGTNNLFLRPVIRIDKTLAGAETLGDDKLTGGDMSGSYFSSNAELSGNTFTGGTAGDIKYMIAKTTDTTPTDILAPVLTTTGTLVLDGKNLTLGYSEVPTGFSVAAALIAETADNLVKTDTKFANVGDNINVDYIAVVDGDGKVKFDGVNNGTYGLKIFGFNNNDSTVTGNHSATDLGNTMINQIKSDNNGLNLTIGSVNTGFTNITLANGAGVTLGADATSTDIGVADGTVSIALGAYKLKGVTIPASTVVKVTSSEGGFGAAITNNGTVDVKGSTTFNGFTNNGESSNLTITEAGTTTFTGAVANGGTANITSSNSTIFTGAVTNSKDMTVTSTNVNNFNSTLTNTGTLNVSGSATFTGKVANNGTDAKIIITNAGTTTFSDEISNTGTIDITSTTKTIFNKGLHNYSEGTLKVTGASEFGTGGGVHNEGKIELYGDAIFNLGLAEGGNLTIKSGAATFGGNDITNTVKIESGSLEVTAANLKNVVTNNGTVKLGGGTLDSSAKITGGNVEIGIKDDVETVSVAVSQFENDPTIKINSNDTLKFTGDVAADKSFNVSGDGKLDVATSGDGKIVLTGDKTLAGITITTGNLQIPAEWILNTSGDAGSYTVTDNDYITGSNANSVLTLKLADGKKWKLVDLNTVTSGIRSYYTAGKVKFDGEFEIDEGATISIKADANGNVTNGVIGVYDTDGNLLGDVGAVPDKYVNVANGNDNPYEGKPMSTAKVSIVSATEDDLVAKGFMIDHSGDAELEIPNAKVILTGGTDNAGNISTPLVDKDGKALPTKVVIGSSCGFGFGVNSGSATTQGLAVKELTAGASAIITITNSYLEVGEVSGEHSKVNIISSYVKNIDGSILSVTNEITTDGSVLNIGDMSVEKMKTAASEWGKSVTDTLGGGFTMNSGAMVGLGSAVAMPSSGKLLVMRGDESVGDKQVYFGADSMLVVNVPTAHAESDFNGGTVQGILYNVASLGSAGSASIYLDGALEESKYYVIVSGDATVGATIINGDGKQTVWDADHIYTSDATLELVPVADPEAMLGIDIGYFRNMIVLKATEGDILMSEPALNSYHPIMEKMVDAPASDDLNKMYADMKNVYRKNHKAGIDAMDSLMGLNSTSSMMRSGIVAANLMSQTTLDHVSLMERSSLNPNYGRSRYADGLRNTVAARDIFEPEYVDVGRSSAVMPVPSRQYTPSKQQNYIAKSYSGKSYSEKSYKAEAPKHYHSSYGSSYNDEDKKVWAEYIHSKETTDGMAVTGNGDNSTSGAVVGFDLWSGDHSFGGVSVAYSQTDVNNSASSTVTKNDIDTYGVGIYTRHDYSHCSMIFDAGYNYSKNDIKQEQNFGHNFEITGKPKVQIYDAGLRYEHSSHVSDKAAFVPYVGVRYTMVDPDSYCTNIGFKYKSKEKDIVSVPLGIRLSFNLYGNGFMVKPYLDFGYQWNFGQKDWKQTVMYDDVMSTLKYDVMDSNSHFINGGVQVYASNFNFGAGYRHSKSSHTKNNKWTINANWDL